MARLAMRSATMLLGLIALAAPAVAADLMLLERQATILGLTQQRATFEDAARALGPAEVKHNGGDAGDSAYYACYVGPDGTTLVLGSHGEMGGGTTLTDFQLLRQQDLAAFSGDGLLSAFADKFQDHARPRCARSPRLSRAVATAAGLRLGMTRAQAQRVLRVKPERPSEDDLTFVLPEPKAPLVRDGLGCDASATVRIELERGRVVAIRVGYWPGEAC